MQASAAGFPHLELIGTFRQFGPFWIASRYSYGCPDGVDLVPTISTGYSHLPCGTMVRLHRPRETQESA